MNNSFPRLIDGMCATLRSEVLTRLDDDFARGQVFGVINLLNTFKVRADWSSGFLLQQIQAQRTALSDVAALLDSVPAAHGAPICRQLSEPAATPIADLLVLRDEGNQAIADLLVWLDSARIQLKTQTVGQIESLLNTAMRAEVDIELKNSPRPLFAQMSSGKDE